MNLFPWEAELQNADQTFRELYNSGFSDAICVWSSDWTGSMFTADIKPQQKPF